MGEKSHVKIKNQSLRSEKKRNYIIHWIDYMQEIFDFDSLVKFREIKYSPIRKKGGEKFV